MKKDVILREFMHICKIPRPSGHEEKVAEYLTSRLRELGLSAYQDEYCNVIGEAPATAGCENVPLTILQAHSDMVCVGAADNKTYDPVNSPIKAIVDGNQLRAVGTSLGADNGAGIAVLLSLFDEDQSFPHGPLRLIFTAGEEVDMQGASHLPPAALKGKYLINVDWDDCGSLCLGCAGGASFRFVTTPIWESPSAGSGFEVELCGLRGGHSGSEIGDGRLNALHELALFLRYVTKRGIPWQLASWSGGKVLNAIPDRSVAVLVIPVEYQVEFGDCFERVRRFLIAQYGKIEERIRLNCTQCVLPHQVISVVDSARIADFVAAFPQGVEKLSSDVSGLVETSANMGVLTMGTEVALEVLARSNNRERLTSFSRDYSALAATYGFATQVLGEFPCWQPTEGGRLRPLAIHEWKRCHNQSPAEVIMHAGLECGYFSTAAPELEIIALGPTIRQIHSAREMLLLDTLVPTALWIAGILTALTEV